MTNGTLTGMQPSSRGNPESEEPSSTRSSVSGGRAGLEHRPGDVVAGKYRLNRVLGLGAMGEVWSATHEELKNDVAIKFLLAQQESSPQIAAGVLARFRFEAQVSARLAAKTRNIVAVYDTGSHRGIPFLVMEYVEGKTLESVIDEHGAITTGELADILDQTCDALSVAHELGFLHRDIKPANLMLTGLGTRSLCVKIADFGVAKSLEVAEALRPDSALDRPKETATGLLVGTPAFMSPEQVQGDGRLDLRSDLWSVGALVYESLTGCQPFTGKTLADLFVAISTREPLRPSTHRPSLSPAIDAWIRQALAKQPELRFQTAKEMAQAFRAALETSPAPRRHFPILGAVAAVAAVAGVIILIRIITADQDPRVEPPSSWSAVDAPISTTAVTPPRPLLAEPVVEPAIEQDPTDRGEPTAAPPRPTANMPLVVPIPDVTSAAPPIASTPPAPVAPPPVHAPPTPTRARPKEIDPSEIQ